MDDLKREPEEQNGDLEAQEAVSQKSEKEEFLEEDVQLQTEEEETEVALETKSTYSVIRKKRRNRTIGLVVATVGILLVALTVLGISDLYGWNRNAETTVEFEIPERSSVKNIAEILQENDLISHKLVFELYIKITGQQDGFLSGVYQLNAGMGYQEILAYLKDPSHGKVQFLVPEGMTLKQIAQKLTDQGVCNGNIFLEQINRSDLYSSYSFAAELGSDLLQNSYYPMEGFAFPATYSFQKDLDEEQVAKTMLQTQESKLNRLMEQIRNASMTLDQTAILASIIQAEAGSVDDMSMISSVLHNRLNHPDLFPKLECDPTRKYAEQIQRDLQSSGRADDGISTRYDTYQCAGLPVGAICNPGVDAIEAALQPADTNYYYFCANIATKECYYAATLEEHNQNLQKAGLTP